MRWLYYAIKHYKLGEIDDGSPIPSTTRAAVYVREIDVPPLDEQRATARILGTLDGRRADFPYHPCGLVLPLDQGPRAVNRTVLLSSLERHKSLLLLSSLCIYHSLLPAG